MSVPFSLSSLLAGLARVEAPVYSAVRLRCTDGEEFRRFHEAMELYARQDWKGAVRGLDAAALMEPESAEISFYLGVTQLLAGETK